MTTLALLRRILSIPTNPDGSRNDWTLGVVWGPDFTPRPARRTPTAP